MDEKSYLPRIIAVSCRIILLMAFTLVLSWEVACYSLQWQDKTMPLHILAVIIFGILYPSFYYAALTDSSEQLKIRTYLIMTVAGWIMFSISVGIVQCMLWITSWYQLLQLSVTVLGSAMISGSLYYLAYSPNHAQQSWRIFFIDLGEVLESIGWHAWIIAIIMVPIMFHYQRPEMMLVTIGVCWLMVRLILYQIGFSHHSTHLYNTAITFSATALLGAATGYILMPSWPAVLIWSFGSISMYFLEVYHFRAVRAPLCEIRYKLCVR